MRDFSNETPINSSVNWLRLAPALLNGHLLASVRTVMTDSANHTAQMLRAAGMRRVAVPQDAGERVDFVAKWVQRNQRRVAAGLPISVLVLALSAAEAQAQEELVSLAAQEGVEGVTILANGDVQVTYTNGNVVVLTENSVVISATGEVLVTVAVAEGAALSAGVAIAGGAGAIGAAGLGAAGLLASLSGGSESPETGGNTGGGTITPDNGVGGRIIDGYIAGATVFRDLNANRILDAGEPSATSDAAGNFTGLTGTGGVIVSVGGTDISTGQPFTGIMTAPAGATVVTPLTTLVQAMIEANPTLSVADANLAVVRAFGFRDVNSNPEDDSSAMVPQNLLTFDPTAGREGLDVFAAGAKVAAVMMVAAAAAGDSAADQAAAVRAVALSLATRIATNSSDEKPLPPLSESAILDALDDALDDDDAIENKANILSDIFTAIDQAQGGFNSTNSDFGAIEDVQTYVQGALIAAIKDGDVLESEAVSDGINRAVSLRPVVAQLSELSILSEPYLSDEPYEINGTGRPGSTVVVKIGGMTSDGIPVDNNGNWTFTLTAEDLPKIDEAVQTRGTSRFVELTATASETTAGGVTITSPTAILTELQIDLTPPDRPEITGQIAGDNVISIVEAAGGVRVQGTTDADVDFLQYWIIDNQRSYASSRPDSMGGASFEFTLPAVSVNGAPALPTADAPFTLNMVSVDRAGNRSEVTSVTLNIDRVAPVAPTLNAVNDGETINAEMAADGIEVSGLVSLAAPFLQDPTDIVRLTFDGVNFIPVVNDGFGNYTATLNADNLPEDDGTYTLRAQRVDTAGNFTEATQQITLDRTPPAAPVLNPILGDAVNGTEDLIITGTAELDSIIIVRINGEQVASASTTNGAFSITVGAQSLTDLSDGQITVSVTAVDGAFNESTAATTTFTYDGTAPEAAVLNPQSNLIFNASETASGVVFTGTAEPLAKVSFQLLTLASNFALGEVIETTADSAGEFSITFANDLVPDGTYTLRTSVEDAAGNSTQNDIPNVVVDRVAPNAPFMSPIGGNNIINKFEAEASGPLFIFGTAEASTATLTNQVEVRFNGITSVFDVNQSGGYTAPFALSNLPATDGTYDVTVVAIDAAGNRSAESTQSILIDRTPPTAPMLNNADALTLLNATETANGLTISGAVTGATRVVVSFAGTEIGVDVNQATNTFSASFTAAQLPQADVGTRIEVTAFDAVGNSSSTVRDVNIDRTPPTAAVITEQFIDGEGYLTLFGNLPTEPNAVLVVDVTTPQGTLSYSAFVDGNTFALDIPSILPDGAYTFVTRITDAAGNQTVGQGYNVQIGVPTEPTAAEAYATALTLEDMIGAVETLINADTGDKFNGISNVDYDILAADLLMQRGGTYSINFTSEVFGALGNPTAVVTDNPTGTDVSGTFHIPVDLINHTLDRLAGQTNPDGVFEFSIELPQGLNNTFTGANALNLPTDVTNLRMEVVVVPPDALLDDTLLAVLGEAAEIKLRAAFSNSELTGLPVYYTYLTIWAPGTTGEGPTLAGNDLTLTFGQLGVVGLNAFFTNPADTISSVLATQYGSAPDGVVGEQILVTTGVSVEFTPTAPLTEAELGDLLLDAATLRAAVANVIQAANAGELTVQLLDTLFDTAGSNLGEAAISLRLLAGEQLQAADVDRLLAFLVQPVADQYAAVEAFNNNAIPGSTTLTQVLDNPLLFPPSLLQGTQVFFDATSQTGLIINGEPVDIDAVVRHLVTVAEDVPVEMQYLDFTNSDLTWQITPQGNVVVAAYIDGPQAVARDVILVFTPEGELKSWVTNSNSQSFYINTTLADADGVVFSMIDAAPNLAEGDTAFTTYRVPLSAFDNYNSEVTPELLAFGRTPLLTFTVPTGGEGFDYNPTSAIELTPDYQIARMLIQVEDAEGDGVQSLLYTGGATPTVAALPAYVYDYSVRVDGPTPLGLLLQTNSIDTNGPAVGGVISQNGVYYFDLSLGEITSVQTMGTDVVRDVLYGQGANDIIIPLGVPNSTIEENIYLPVMQTAGVQGVETIVVDLADVFAGNKIAIQGFDLAEDKIAFFGSSPLTSNLLNGANFSVRSVTVDDAANFNTADILTALDMNSLPSGLNFFAVNDGGSTILFVTEGLFFGEVAYLDNVAATAAAQSTGGLNLSAFPLEDLLVPLPT